MSLALVQNSLQAALIAKGLRKSVGKALAEKVPVSLGQKGFVLSFDLREIDVAGLPVTTQSGSGNGTCSSMPAETKKLKGVQVDIDSLLSVAAVQSMNILHYPLSDGYRLYVNLEVRNPNDKNVNAWMEGLYGKLFLKCCRGCWKKATVRSETETKAPGVTFTAGWATGNPGHLLVFE